MTSLHYRLIAIDLDGTLLHSQTHKVSPGNASAVARTLAQGVIVTLASGRQHETIAAFAAEMRFPESSPIISYNGALVRTLAGETITHHPLPADAAEQIVRFCAENDCHLNYYLNDVLYVRDDTRWGRIYQERTGSVPRVMHDMTGFDGCRPTKLLLIDTKSKTDALLTHFQAQFGDTLYITKTEDEYLEFMDRGVSKSAALARVAHGRGIPQAACAAIGDSFNDVPMLRWAGLGIAMSSGKKEAQDAADVLAPPADEDGVATMLDRLIPQP